MMLLNKDFPGSYRKLNSNYQYYLPGDLFLSKHLNFGKISKLLEETTFILARFSVKIEDIPDIDFFIKSYLKLEAQKSSTIEGTQSTNEEVFIDNQAYISQEKRNDWAEVMQYIEALNFSIKKLDQLPLSNHLIKETHKTLLSQFRGKNKNPGEFRTSQNWIGGNTLSDAYFVPPSQEYVAEAMGNLEKFIHDKSLNIPDLIKIALIHYQFETIHPFLDGNGRIGRILIPLYLLEKKLLNHPILYISDYLESNRQQYYDALNNARKNKKGVEDWIEFFLNAVKNTANQGIIKTKNILELKENLSKNLIKNFGKRAPKAQALINFLFQHPVIFSKEIRERFGYSAQVTQNLLNTCLEKKILKLRNKAKRNRVFIFQQYLEILFKK